MTEDMQVERFIKNVEDQLGYLDDETRSLSFLQTTLLLEILKELRYQRMNSNVSTESPVRFD